MFCQWGLHLDPPVPLVARRCACGCGSGGPKQAELRGAGEPPPAAAGYDTCGAGLLRPLLPPQATPSTCGSCFRSATRWSRPRWAGNADCAASFVCSFSPCNAQQPLTSCPAVALLLRSRAAQVLCCRCCTAAQHAPLLADVWVTAAALLLDPPSTQVTFVPPSPVHPHIYSNGHICLDIL